MKIYVGNLDRSVNADQIKESFAPFGEVAKVFVVLDRETGRSRGFGFVEMEDRQSGTNAIAALHETLIEESRVNVNEAREQSPDRSGRRNGART